MKQKVVKRKGPKQKVRIIGRTEFSIHEIGKSRIYVRAITENDLIHVAKQNNTWKVARLSSAADRTLLYENPRLSRALGYAAKIK